MTVSKKNSLVSVLIPNWNSEDYIEEAVKSILNQTYKNFELIILDDGSTDKGFEILSKLAKKSKQIKLYQNKKNLGIVKSRNKLFKLCSKNSKYIALLDSDDYSYPKRLEKQVNFLEKNQDYSIVGSNIIIMDEKSRKIGFRKYDLSFNKIKHRIYVKTILAQSSVMIRKSSLEKAGMYYRDKYAVCEDWELYFRLFKFGKIANLKDYLIKYRISITQSKTTKLKLFIINGIKIKREYAKKNKYFSITYLIRNLIEMILLLVPAKLILYLFKKMEYKK